MHIRELFPDVKLLLECNPNTCEMLGLQDTEWKVYAGGRDFFIGIL